MKYTFIVNPKSSSGNGAMIWKRIEPELMKRRVEYEVRFTRYARHAVEIAAEATADGEERVLVVLGGDGTMNEVVSGISDSGKVILGSIPTGSGNDFSRAPGLPKDPLRALEVILDQERLVPMDIGTMRCKDREHRFAVSTGIGFDAAVCHCVAKSGLKVLLNKFGLGRLSYLIIAIQRLLGDKRVPCKLWLDDGPPIAFEGIYFAAVMNHPYEGGGFFFCPKAEIGDGYLDVIVVSDIPTWKIFLLLPTAFWGGHVKYHGIDVFRCRRARLECGEALPVHTDGEPIPAEMSLEAGLCENQVRLIVPAG